MPSRRFSSPAAAAALLLALAACGGHDATAPVTGLRADEAAGLAVEMGMALSSAGAPTPSVAPAGVSASASSAPFTWTLSQVLPCPKGGTTTLTGTVSGSYDAATQSMVMDVAGTQEPQDCAVLVKQVTFTTRGAPSLSSVAHLEAVGGAPAGTFTSTTTGGFTWSASDGRSGTCTVNYTSTADFAAQTVTVTGSFCGATIDHQGSFTR